MPNEESSETPGRDVAAMVDEARTRVADLRDRALGTMDAVDQRLSTAMRDNPLVVLGAAAAVGYVIGRVFSRLG